MMTRTATEDSKTASKQNGGGESDPSSISDDDHVVLQTHAAIRQKVEDIVTALVDKKQRDVETLRQYLAKNSSWRSIEVNTPSRQQGRSSSNHETKQEGTNSSQDATTARQLRQKQQQQQHQTTKIKFEICPSPRTSRMLSAVVTSRESKTSLSSSRTIAGSTTGTTTSTAPAASSRSWLLFDFLRCILLDLPLATLFLLLVLAYGVRHVHNHYLEPLLYRVRRTDAQLMDEFTYYERACTAMDVTTHNLTDLVFDSNSQSIDDAVDQMMTHGVLLIPQVLPPDIVRDLRRHIVDRNAHLTESEFIPLSQGRNRISFGMDATESDIVSRAIEHVANNQVLEPLVEQLVGGTDPAVTELNVITAYFGSIDQVWHPDVKPDGNAAKYGRTYSHSYSLFIPLQDTAHTMGATDICPGTHYCTNDLINVCEANKLSLGQSSPTHGWKAGDAALLNQQVWHRGARHQDQHALSRVVFMMSFMARPTVDDPRQFPRGTYFHMKWNMWGHTWQDLKDARYSMIKPFSILRSLGLWKLSANRHWGYDLITASLFRIANNQLGMQAEDLHLFVRYVMDRIHYPKWLQGPLPKDDNDAEAWQVYIQETINRAVLLLRIGNAVALGLYILVSFIFVRINGRTTILGTVRRLLVVYGLISVGALFSLERFENSNWAFDVKLGKLFHRPFSAASTSAQPKDNITSFGPTTLPNRADVLVGARYDAEFLGAYSRWLDYHPGNVAFQSGVSEIGPIYQSYGGLPNAFRERVLADVISRVTDRKDRFLEQEPNTGDWRIMSQRDASHYAHLELITYNGRRVQNLLQAFRLLMAFYRFGRFRDTKLSGISLSHLSRLQGRLFVSTPIHFCYPSNCTLQMKKSLHIFPTLWRGAKPNYRVQRYVSSFRKHSVGHRSLQKAPQNNTADNLGVGDVVLCNYLGEGTFLYASIAKVGPDGFFDVVYYNGDVELNVEPSRVVKYFPVEERAAVLVNRQGSDEWSKGVISRVMPNGAVDVVYENGEKDIRIEPRLYRIVKTSVSAIIQDPAPTDD